MDSFKTIRFAMADIDYDGSVHGNVVWYTGTVDQAMRDTKYEGGKRCALFLYKDIRHLLKDTETFYTEKVGATREQFENDPVRCGIAYYKQPLAGGGWVFG